jgi:hypothetical protein
MKNKIINITLVNYFIIITQTCLFSTSFYFMLTIFTYSAYQKALKRRLETSPRIFEIDPLPFNFVARLNINIS